jgi:hypothetical protein
MSEILPNGEIQSYYGGYCKLCGAEICVNMQGTPIGAHTCAAPQKTVEQNRHIAQQPQGATENAAPSAAPVVRNARRKQIYKPGQKGFL